MTSFLFQGLHPPPHSNQIVESPRYRAVEFLQLFPSYEVARARHKAACFFVRIALHGNPSLVSLQTIPHSRLKSRVVCYHLTRMRQRDRDAFTVFCNCAAQTADDHLPMQPSRCIM